MNTHVAAEMGDAEAGDKQALCICCFGRGGSSLLWHLLGSSPDIWMMRNEWHEAVFEGLNLLRRVMRRSTRGGLIRSFGNGDGPQDRMAQRFSRRRVEANLAPDDDLQHPQARYIGMKVMDYNIFWHDGIKRAFGGGRTVILMRRPLPQCESLMRSGLTLEEACQKYNDVATHMADLAARPGSVVVHFEAFLADPDAVMAETYAGLGVTPPDSYVAKVKPYGADRQAQTDVSERKLRRFPCAELRAFVNPGVDEAGAARLSQEQADQIRSLTAEVAGRLGY